MVHATGIPLVVNLLKDKQHTGATGYYKGAEERTVLPTHNVYCSKH